jgi:flagellar biosynthesis/type III secretory pathway M-ring protein FliF/YscJ
MTGGGIEPSASVNITMSESTGEAKRRQVAGAAASVGVGSQAGMKTDRIKVIVNGHGVRLSSGGSADSATASLGGDPEELFNRRLQVEQTMEKGIADLFAIPGLRVKVAAKINNSFVSSEEDKVDPKTVVVKPVKEETHTLESGAGAAPGEPGTVPNVGDSINSPLEIGTSSGGGSTGTKETTEKNENVVISSRTKTSTRTAGGEATVTSASVRVPHSHFVDAFRQWKRLAAGTQPDDQALQDFIKSELDSVGEQVRASAGMTPDSVVSVNDYFDAAPPEGSLAAVPQTATMSIPVTIGKYGREIALSGLALVSLFMVSMMVKKSAPAPIAVAPTTVSGPPPLMVGEAVAGEASEGGSMLDGMELDEDAVKTEQMLDQVSTLVKENPDGAAALVKRWLNRD